MPCKKGYCMQNLPLPTHPGPTRMWWQWVYGWKRLQNWPQTLPVAYPTGILERTVIWCWCWGFQCWTYDVQCWWHWLLVCQAIRNHHLILNLNCTLHQNWSSVQVSLHEWSQMAQVGQPEWMSFHNQTCHWLSAPCHTISQSTFWQGYYSIDVIWVINKRQISKSSYIWIIPVPLVDLYVLSQSADFLVAASGSVEPCNGQHCSLFNHWYWNYRIQFDSKSLQKCY